MMSLLDYALIVVIVVECIFAGLSLLRREPELPTDVSLEQAFDELELSIKQSYPTLPEGYTWKEVLLKLKRDYGKQSTIDWPEIEDTLKRYESFRYGGIKFESGDTRPILRVARMLRRREWIVR